MELHHPHISDTAGTYFRRKNILNVSNVILEVLSVEISCLCRFQIYTDNKFDLNLGSSNLHRQWFSPLIYIQEKAIYTDNGFILKSNFTKKVILTDNSSTTTKVQLTAHVSLSGLPANSYALKD